MRILLKCPTRSRPSRIIDTLRAYATLARDRANIGVALSCDEDDTSMTQVSIQRDLNGLLGGFAWNRIFFSKNTSKIAACNANMNEIDYPWDIVVLVSDDMIPRLEGWDDAIRTHMKAYFPDTNGILWFNDGHQADKLNTLCIFGRKFYESQGYIYHPDYKSLFCDTELTDRCKTDLAPICKYIPYTIIRHEHPGTGYKEKMDPLYARNQVFWNQDLHTYIRRKVYPYDWSILIPTIPGRDAGLTRLVESIREKVDRISPHLRIQLCISFDNKESSIGVKRQSLLDEAKGKYLSFIDDDDEITDAYIEDLSEMIRGGYHTMRLRGQMSQYTFVHSTEMTMSSPMATMDDPPVFQRPPNHLNPMIADAAKLVPFKNAVHGEDLDWTLGLFRTKYLETEYRSDPSRIHYIYNLGARVVHPETVDMQRKMNYESMLGLIFTPAGSISKSPTTDQAFGPRQLRLTGRGFVSK